MKGFKVGIYILLILNLALISSPETKGASVESEFSGHFEVEFRHFPSKGLSQEQKNSYLSTVLQPEFFMEWDNRNQLLQFTGFARLDQYHNSRSHIDIRELYWQMLEENWDFSVGVKQIFWGVTESNHLVDIINQYDMYEGIDVEQKLGQPMIHFSSGLGGGAIDLIGMIYSREAEFPGEQGRPRPSETIAYDDAKYESSQNEFNPDYAVRWSANINAIDIGLSYFNGNTRLPRFISTKEQKIVPYYELVSHFGIDLQALTGAMLWKMEVIKQFRQKDEIVAFTLGGEYVIDAIFSSNVEVALMAEYTHDERDEEVLNAFNNDIFVGTRIAFNDEQSTDVRAAYVTDLELGTRIYSLQFNRRLNNSWKVQLDAKLFDYVNVKDVLYANRKDSYIQTSLVKYF